MKLYKQADEIFNYIIIKNGPYIFDLDSESESDSADNVNILDNDNNIPVITPAGSSGSLGSHKTPGTPPSKLKNTKLSNSLYLTPSSGQSERSASKISNIITNLGNLEPSRIIIV